MAGSIDDALGSEGAVLMQRALLDSRQRWQDFVRLAADVAWETDEEGRLTFLSPDVLLGWRSSDLLGRPAASLLADLAVFDPFVQRAGYRGRQTWLRGADGRIVCFRFSAAPLLDDHDRRGMRGVAQDVTADEEREAQASRAVRRGAIMEHILRQMRQEVLAPRMMQSVLEELASALGAEGAAVLDVVASATPNAIKHAFGTSVLPLLPALHAALQDDMFDPAILKVADQTALVCPCYTRFGDRAGLALWRAHGAAPWSDEEAQLVASATALVRVVLEHESLQRDLSLQARTDPLTGLLNRRAFLEETERRIDRLDRERLPGTLMFVDLDHFKALNDLCGHDVGDEALVAVAQLLRGLVRPIDLVARLGGDEFAVWLDGADELTAAERAEQLRLDGGAAIAARLPPMAPPLSLSVGVAARYAHNVETLDEVIRRADAAMYEAKRAGRAQWRVSPNPRVV